MKRTFYNILILLLGFQVSIAQECHNGLFNYLNTTEINKLHVATSFDLEGSTIEEKGQSFVLTISQVLSQRLGVTVTYEVRTLNVNQSTYMIYDQYIDGELVEGSGLVLGFDNDGNLSSFNHLGAVTSDDIVMGITTGNSLEAIRIPNNQEAEPLRNLGSGTPTAGHINIDFPVHSYNYDCPAGLSGLTEVGVGGATGTLTSNRLTLVEIGGFYSIADCDSDIISFPAASNFGFDGTNYLVCPEDPATTSHGQFEYAMTYFHLTELSEYFKTAPCVSEVGTLGQIVFDPYDLGASTTYQFAMNSGLDILTMGAVNPTGGSYHDLAEDAHMILQGGLHYWYKFNSPFMFPDDSNTGDGMIYGLLDYLTYSYANSHPAFQDSPTDLLTWGENGSNERSVDLDASEVYPDFVNSWAGPFQGKGQVLGTALKEIADHSLLGADIADELAFKSMALLNSLSTQIDAAMAIIQKAHDIGLSDYQICAIETILANRYPNSIVSSESFDFYIRDEVWDTGVEGSDAARHYVSPDIWNRHSDDEVEEHENPIHNNDENNYLYVRLRDRECGIPNGKLMVYFSESSTSHAWPSDWNNPAPTQDNYTYKIGEYPLTSFIDTWEDNTTGEDVFLYEVPWVPYDPTDFGFEDGAHVHGCLLIRIDTELPNGDPGDDPMFNEVDGSNVKHNIKVNNNIGSINTTVIHVSSSNIIPPTSERHRLLVRHYALNGSAKQTGVVNDRLVVEVMPSGPNSANAIFDYGNVEIELSDELLEAWRKGGQIGKGLRFQAPNKIVITDAYASMNNILIELIKKYPINVSFKQKRALDFPIEFHINLETESGCNVGGEKYILRPSRKVVKGGKGDETDKETDGGDLEGRSSTNKSTIYPNPAINVLTINHDTEIKSFEIIDAQGQIIRNVDYKYDNNIKIDLTAFETGVYYINLLLVDGSSEVHKFVKI